MLSLLRTENGFTTDIFVVKCTGRGLVVKRPGVLSKVQMLNLVLGVGVFSLLPRDGSCHKMLQVVQIVVTFLQDPRSGITPKWGFGVAMLPVGALCFYQAYFGRTVLPKWPLWAHLF